MSSKRYTPKCPNFLDSEILQNLAIRPMSLAELEAILGQRVPTHWRSKYFDVWSRNQKTATTRDSTSRWSLERQLLAGSKRFIGNRLTSLKKRGYVVYVGGGCWSVPPPDEPVERVALFCSRALVII